MSIYSVVRAVGMSSCEEESSYFGLYALSFPSILGFLEEF